MVERLKASRILAGALLSVVGLLLVVLVFLKNNFFSLMYAENDVEVPMKAVGQALVGSEKYQYVLPFEFISIFLLACIIGALVVSRKAEED